MKKTITLLIIIAALALVVLSACDMKTKDNSVSNPGASTVAPSGSVNAPDSISTEPECSCSYESDKSTSGGSENSADQSADQCTSAANSAAQSASESDVWGPWI